MATLHIEHAISDFMTWKRAFDGFAEMRSKAGVSGQRIYQLSDDSTYIVLQLDFPTVEQAKGFKEFLENKVWASPDRSPALAGAPRARILVDAPH